MIDEITTLTTVQNYHPYCKESQTRLQTFHEAIFEI